MIVPSRKRFAMLLALLTAGALLHAGVAGAAGGKLRRVLQGTSGKDHIVGNARDNKIYGGRSADRLFGGPGRPAAGRHRP